MYTVGSKKKTFFLYTLCTLMPKIITLLTLMLVRTWYEEFTLQVAGNKVLLAFDLYSQLHP